MRRQFNKILEAIAASLKPDITVRNYTFLNWLKIICFMKTFSCMSTISLSKALHLQVTYNRESSISLI